MSYELVYTKQGQKDVVKISSSGLKSKVLELLSIIEKEPFQKYPPFEILIGDLEGAYSRRINILHLLVFQVLENEKTVKILRMWTHYVK